MLEFAGLHAVLCRTLLTQMSESAAPFNSLTGVSGLADAVRDRYVVEGELGHGGMATVYLAGPQTRSPGRAQGPPARAGRCARRRPFSPRDPAHRHPPAPPHPAAARLGRSRRPATTTSCRLSRESRSATRIRQERQLPVDEALRSPREVAGRPGVRPRAGRHPPRHQAGEHPALPRARAGGGLRDRAGGEPGRRRAAHRDRAFSRHAGVHEPRAGDGRRDPRRPLRPVQPGLRAVRDAGGRASLYRADSSGDHRQAASRAGAEPSDGARGPAGARGSGDPSPGQGTRGSVSLHGGVRRGPVESGGGPGRPADTVAKALGDPLGSRLARFGPAVALGLLLLRAFRPASSEFPGALQRRQQTFSGQASDPAISPDGTSLAYVRGRRELVLEPVAGGAATTLVEAKSWISWPRWSPDGDWLYFTMLRTNTETPGLYRVPARGGTPARLVSGLGLPDLSPDGRTLVRAIQGALVFHDAATGAEQRRIDLPLDSSTVRWLADLDVPFNVAWSPDGRWIASDNFGGRFSSRPRMGVAGRWWPGVVPVRFVGDLEAPRSTISPSSREAATTSSGCRSIPAAVRRRARSGQS